MDSQNKNFKQQKLYGDDSDSPKKNQDHKGDESQLDIDNSIAQVIKGLEMGSYQDIDLNNSQMHQVVNNNQNQGGYPMSSKSQQNQSFIMNNSVLQLNNADYSEERGNLNGDKFKNQNSAKTNVYSNNTSLILNGSIMDDNSFKSPSLKKNINIGKEFRDVTDQSYEINIGNQLNEGNESNNYPMNQQYNQPQHQLKPALKKPTHLPPILRQPKNQGNSQRGSVNYQDMSNNNSNQNSVILKAKQGDKANIMLDQEVDQHQIALSIVQKDQQSLSNSQVSNKSKQGSKADMIKKKKPYRCIQILFPKCKLRSTVTAMCALFVVFFMIQLILESANKQKRACTAYKIGCEFQPSVTNGGEVHRLLLSSLLHASWFHIISSVFTFLFYGFVLEAHYGVAKMIWLYIVCGFSGNIFVGVIEPYELQIGPNSILMGMFILQSVFLFTIRKRIPKSKRKPILGMYILLVVTNFLCIIESLTVKASSYLGQFHIENLHIFIKSELEKLKLLMKEIQYQTNLHTQIKIGGIIAGIFLSFAFYKAQNPSRKFQLAQKGSLIILGIINLSMFIAAMTNQLDDIQIAGLDRCSA